MQPIIIHISNDFPDILAPDKTKAVERLVDSTPEFRHIVYSLNRVNGWKGISALPFGKDRLAIAYKALPKGFFWESRLREVGDFIINDLKKNNIEPDLIEGHKFSVEGLIAEQVAAHFKKPFIIDIQGDTDTRILEMKPNLRSRYQAIADKASLIFPYAHWPIAQFQKFITLPTDKIRVLPVIPALEILSPSPIVDMPRFLTVFHLDSWSRKNILGILTAMKEIKSDIPDIHLDICGRGSAKTLLSLKKMVGAMGMESSVTFLGPAPNGDLPALMRNYVGFVLPSKRESYGLVFAEALFSGLPILFSKNRGIDGFFTTEKIGYAADPFNSSDIAKGMRHILTHQATLKSSIDKLQAAGTLNKIRKNEIIEQYRKGLLGVLAATK